MTAAAIKERTGVALPTSIIGNVSKETGTMALSQKFEDIIVSIILFFLYNVSISRDNNFNTKIVPPLKD